MTLQPRTVMPVAATCFVALALPVARFGARPGEDAVRDGLLAIASPSMIATMRVINEVASAAALLARPGRAVQDP